MSPLQATGPADATVTVSAWHNVTRDGAGHPTGYFGFTPGDLMVKVLTYDTQVRGRHPEDIAKTPSPPRASSADVKPVHGATHHSQWSEAFAASWLGMVAMTSAGISTALNRASGSRGRATVEISSSLSASRTIPCTTTGYVAPGVWVQPSALPHMLHDPSARRAATTE